MKTTTPSLIPWFRGSFYFGMAFSLFATGALIFEIVKNGNGLVESLIGHLGISLLLLFFSGKPMVDERIRILKFKALTMAFVITCLLGSMVNYIFTYPDAHQEQALSSYWFALICLLIAFVCYGILKHRE